MISNLLFALFYKYKHNKHSYKNIVMEVVIDSCWQPTAVLLIIVLMKKNPNSLHVLKAYIDYGRTFIFSLAKTAV